MTGPEDEAVELTAVLWSAPEGGYCALNPETGTTSERESQADALRNLEEATSLFLEEFPLSPAERPFRLASEDPAETVEGALDALAAAGLDDREHAWGSAARSGNFA